MHGDGQGVPQVVALSGIVLVAMVPPLSIAAIISCNLYKRTGNSWTPASLNALLMTTMAVANILVAFKYCCLPTGLSLKRQPFSFWSVHDKIASV